MKRCLAIGVGVLCWGLAAWGQGAVTNRPALVCPEPAFNMGQVQPGFRTTHDFILTNQAAEGAVTITSVRAGCGCLATRLDTNVVAAGQAARLSVDVSLPGRSGSQRKAIYLQTDDPLAQVVRLEVSGTILSPVDVNPEGVHFGTLGSEGEVEKAVLLTAVGTNRFAVLSVSNAHASFAAVAETVETGRVYRIRIACKGPRSLGSATDGIQVETDLPGMPTMTIPVAVFTTADIVAAPASLMLLATGTNQPRTYFVTVYSPAGKPFGVTNLVAPGALGCSLTNMAPGRVRLEVKAGGALTGVDGAVLKLETDYASVPVVEIPLRVLTLPTQP